MEAVDDIRETQENVKIIRQKLDFKMVTFSLGGKDYGIDIMRVKEISKVEKYTYVPNTLPYVLGVHNMRGDIISIIDMRKMFNIQDLNKQIESVLNIIILRLSEYKLGIVVDSINKVISISSENIQPPPPLFGDINIKYINGVVEAGNRLYIILDVDKIFLEDKDSPSYKSEVMANIGKMQSVAEISEQSMHEFSFIVETLATFKKFYVTDLNRTWVQNRFKEWKEAKGAQGEDFQLKNENDADIFLKTFFSAHTGALWEEAYMSRLSRVLPELKGTINAWNTGCARGHEAYSIALMMRNKYPKEIIKVWANDNDLLSVSTAPTLYFNEMAVPEYMKNSNMLEKGKNGYQFKKEMKDLIYFEYHDTLHKSAMPYIDLIVARDIMSFQNPANQKKMLSEFDDKLKKGGLLVLGDNEVLDESGWNKLDIDGINIYRKES